MKCLRHASRQQCSEVCTKPADSGATVPVLPLAGDEAACILDRITYKACAQQAAQDGCTPRILSMVSLPGHPSIERGHGSPAFTLVHKALRMKFHGALSIVQSPVSAWVCEVHGAQDYPSFSRL